MSVVPLEAALDAAAHDLGSRTRTIEVWDLPLRVFHWSLVLAIAAAFVTGRFGGSDWAQWHGRIGEFISGLLIFRIVWGLIGPRYSRFHSFVPTPSRVRAYLSGKWSGHGHNPLGALSVIALLLLVGSQVVTGFFANDDISFAGPWADWIGKAKSDSLTAWHQDLFYVLVGVIALHIVAIGFYLFVRRTNLIVPMITGRKRTAIYEKHTRSSLLWFRFAIALTVAIASTSIIFHTGSTQHAEAAEVPVASPDW